jgi:outer membrane protein assembly factor BamB
MHLLNLATGRTVSSHRVNTLPLESPYCAGESVLFLSGPSSGATIQLISYNIRADSIAWRLASSTIADEARYTVPRLHASDSAVVIGTQSGVIAAVSRSDGRILWRVQAVGAIRGIGSAGKFIYVGNLEGHLYAYRLP